MYYSYSPYSNEISDNKIKEYINYFINDRFLLYKGEIDASIKDFIEYFNKINIIINYNHLKEYIFKNFEIYVFNQLIIIDGCGSKYNINYDECKNYEDCIIIIKNNLIYIYEEFLKEKIYLVKKDRDIILTNFYIIFLIKNNEVLENSINNIKEHNEIIDKKIIEFDGYLNNLIADNITINNIDIIELKKLINFLEKENKKLNRIIISSVIVGIIGVIYYKLK